VVYPVSQSLDVPFRSENGGTDIVCLGQHFLWFRRLGNNDSAVFGRVKPRVLLFFYDNTFSRLGVLPLFMLVRVLCFRLFPVPHLCL